MNVKGSSIVSPSCSFFCPNPRSLWSFPHLHRFFIFVPQGSFICLWSLKSTLPAPQEGHSNFTFWCVQPVALGSLQKGSARLLGVVHRISPCWKESFQLEAKAVPKIQNGFTSQKAAFLLFETSYGLLDVPMENFQLRTCLCFPGRPHVSWVTVSCGPCFLPLESAHSPRLTINTHIVFTVSGSQGISYIFNELTHIFPQMPRE